VKMGVALCSALADIPSSSTCVRSLEKKYLSIMASCLELISSQEYATIQGREVLFFFHSCQPANEISGDTTQASCCLLYNLMSSSKNVSSRLFATRQSQTFF
jgi:hypothetical protein